MTALDVIADPVRLAVVRHLAAHRRASLPELARAAGVHVNTARPHVAALEAAGLLAGERRPAAGPGRPAVDYRLVEGWTLSATDFLGLAELLATALLRGGHDPDAVRALGREWGGYLLGRPGARDPADLARELPRALERLGFDARLGDETGDGTGDEVGDEVELSACPCPLVAPDAPQMICGLAVGVVEGVLAAAGSGLRVARRDHHPQRRRCTLTLDRPGTQQPEGNPEAT